MYDIRFLQAAQLAERRAIFAALVADGVAKTVFYNCASPTFENFEAVAGPSNGWCVPVYHQNALAAVGWINGFIGRAAFVHFCFRRSYMSEAVGIGRAWCTTVFATGKFDCLLGLTPVIFRHALNFITQIGFELSPLGVPGACFIARKGLYVDGIYSRLVEVK